MSPLFLSQGSHLYLGDAGALHLCEKMLCLLAKQQIQMAPQSQHVVLHFKGKRNTRI